MTTQEQAAEAWREVQRRSWRSAMRYVRTLPPEVRQALAEMGARLIDEARRQETKDAQT